MKTVITLLFVGIGSQVFGQESNPFFWLAGTWEIKTTQGSIIESWSVANDSTLYGASFFVKSEGDTIPQESIQLVARLGAWYYIPSVRDQNDNLPVEFSIVYRNGPEFIATKPDHDFPQRIAYRRIGNYLYASIEGTRNGKFRKSNFDFLLRD